ncbi:DUF4124 domain-containing protein [Chitinimonas viridis]|uniref:DUF4124 domain-containing protein n=2 Tax=Chitinimonas TaxID=240411 RepID=A0ABT8B8Y8_9NEIS|nr:MULTISPECIES: DUF4124 domain-containing protein [Chitinimonas]MDN3578096.1 DUF4124 domain-containing protein [Chitinimonas viridis]GLR11977.1 hypothetical protein GCM10007907_07670 [Chitinimonas prasina]
MSHHRLLILPLIAMALTAHAGETLYKWVDENGKVQYSDKPPMQQNKRGMTELNKQGMPIRQTEGILTPEQQAARNAELAKLREEERKALEARRRDNALVNSFSKTSEIDAIRDRNLEQLQANIQSDRLRLEAATKRVNSFQTQIDKLTKAKKKVPNDLMTDLTERQAEVAKINASIAARNLEIEEVKNRAEADKKRLVELRGESVRR